MLEDEGLIAGTSEGGKKLLTLARTLPCPLPDRGGSLSVPPGPPVLAVAAASVAAAR
jgi:hypothetical protein